MIQRALLAALAAATLAGPALAQNPGGLPNPPWSDPFRGGGDPRPVDAASVNAQAAKCIDQPCVREVVRKVKAQHPRLMKDLDRLCASGANADPALCTELSQQAR